jgi:WD40-like Beta Propeller Repeat
MRAVRGSEVDNGNRALVAKKKRRRKPAIFFDGELLDRGPSSIWRIKPNGRNLRLLDRAGRRAVPSANGRKVYFLTPKNRGSVISVMRPDGSHRKKLGGKTPRTAFAGFGTFQVLSQRGRLAYFDDPHPSGDPGGETVKVVNAEGSGRRTLYEIPTNSLLTALAISANGRRIAVAETSFAGLTQNAPHLRVINSDGSGLRTIYTGAARQMITGLAFSPDGDRIAASAYAQTATGEITNPELLVMDGEGSDLQRIAYPDPVEIGAAPTFSPSGTRLAFTGYFEIADPRPRPSDFGEIFTIGVNGQGLSQITGPDRPGLCDFCAGIDRASSWGRVVVK